MLPQIYHFSSFLQTLVVIPDVIQGGAGDQHSKYFSDRLSRNKTALARLRARQRNRNGTPDELSDRDLQQAKN